MSLWASQVRRSTARVDNNYARVSEDTLSAGLTILPIGC